MPARAIGTATISFGLVSIPVKLYTTSESGSDISFNMLHDACGSRLKQQYICSKDGEVVDREHTIKGYEFSKGQYVTFTADELKTLDAVATNSIELTEFVPVKAVDPLLFEKSYYIGPDKGGERAYKLLSEAMVQSGLMGIASYSARGKQYVVAVRPFQNGLIVHQLRYKDEVKDWAEVPIPDLPELKPTELALAQQLIAQITHETFDPAKYEDEVKKRMLELIQAKVDGQEITAAPEAPQGKIIDLMEALKASLGMSGAALPTTHAAAAPAAPAAEKKKSRKKSA
ncbi:MAG TPA: Ku protein [Nocardioides sp.]|nr:Ku protein [Nocardioides sp.]